MGSATGGEDAVTLCREQRPDVLLLDLQMPDIDGIEVTRRVAVGSPDTRVVVFTSFSDRDGIVRALDAGAIGYLLKDAEPEEIHEAIRAASRGEAPITPRAAVALLADRRERPASSSSPRGSGGPPSGGRGPCEQADRPPPGHQREDGEGSPDEPVPADRGRVTEPRRRFGPSATGCSETSPGTEVPLLVARSAQDRCMRRSTVRLICVAAAFTLLAAAPATGRGGLGGAPGPLLGRRSVASPRRTRKAPPRSRFASISSTSRPVTRGSCSCPTTAPGSTPARGSPTPAASCTSSKSRRIARGSTGSRAAA